MATSLTFIDDLIRDYCHYRSFTATPRTFDQESSKLPLGHFRADRMIEQLTLSIHQFDLANLIEYWTQIEQRLLSTLPLPSPSPLHVFTKIRLHLYRCYLMHAVQSSRMDKITEFFDRLTKVLQQSNDWSKDWFALPFIANPEEHPVLKIYFSKQWNELFWTSLQNFLAMAIFHMSSPKIASLQDENGESPQPELAAIGPAMTRASSTTSSGYIQPPLTFQAKLRSQFQSQLPTRSLPVYSSPAKLIVTQPVQESTTGNQIFLSSDD